MSVAAFLACMFCWLCGMKLGGTTVFLGYWCATYATKGRLRGKHLQIASNF